MKFLPFKVICMIEAKILVNRLFLCPLRTANRNSNSEVFIPIEVESSPLFYFEAPQRRQFELISQL